MMIEREFDIEYNTEREIMTIAEYGRNIQKMIDYLVTIKDRDERTAYAKEIVKTMGIISVNKEDLELYQNKLWDHLFLMAGGELDVDFPFEKPSMEAISQKPEKLDYSKIRIKYRMYGANIQRMIEVARTMEEGEERTDLILVVANSMKRSYMAWNKTLVEDSIIFKHLAELSKETILLDDKVKLKSSHFLHAEIKKENILKSGRSLKSNHNKSKSKSKSKKKYKKKW